MIDFVVKYWLEIVFGLIVSLICYVVKKLKNKLEEQDIKNTAIEQGVQALLRNELIRRYREYENKGEISIIDMENIEHMFEEYKNLGGNGTIAKMYEDMMNLPRKMIEK